jgi:hypothetical protein
MHFPAIHPKRDSIRCGRILSAVAILMTASCGCCDDHLASIEVIPSIVTAVPDRPFLMTVRLWNERGQLMSETSAADVKWKSSDARLTVNPVGGAQTKAKLSGSPPSPVILTASVGGVSGTARITLAQPGTSFGMDWATAEHTNDEPPTLLLADGQNPVEWRSDSVIAFVGGGPLDQFGVSDLEGEVTVFSPGHALQRMKVPWIDDCDLVRMREGTVVYAAEMTVSPCTERGMSLAKATSIKIHAWTLTLAVDPTGAAESPTGAVDAELAEARRRLANGWTGLTLDLESPIDALGARTIVMDIREELGGKCLMGTEEFSVPAQLTAADPRFPGLVGPDKITVVYAQQLLRPGSAAGAPSSFRGYTCQWDKTFGTIALVAWDIRAGTTLLHELGHAIGPWVEAPFGHTEAMVGFDGSNLMWGWHAAVPAPRQILTLGQAFRLALDGDAFSYRMLTPHPDPRCIDQNQGVETPCPRIKKDVTNR